MPYEETGRTRQKARTRAALLAATRQLLREGSGSTVEQAADRAGISRTTAYRYFPNQKALLQATYPQMGEASLLGNDPPAEPAERLAIVARNICEQLFEWGPELRAQLRLSLQPGPVGEGALPLRQGRAIGWIEEALAPLRDIMSARQLHRLAISIRATLGIEPFVWLTDIAGVSRKEAGEIMCASAQTLLRSAIAEAVAGAEP